MTTIPIHIYRADNVKRVRRLCPYHKHQCYGTMHEYYDTTRVFLDCGTGLDYGYGDWTPPKKTKCPHCRKHFRPIEMQEHLMKDHKGVKE